MNDGLHLYPSSLTRDAALTERSAQCGVVWTEQHLTFGQFFALLDRRLPRDTRPRGMLSGTHRYLILKQAWMAAGLVDSDGNRKTTASGQDARAPGPRPSPAASDAQENTAKGGQDARAPGDAPGRKAVEALGRLIASWKAAGVLPATLAKAARHASFAEHLGQRLHFLAAAFAEYERLLGIAWTDLEGWQQEVLARLERHGIPTDALLPRTPVCAHGLYRMIPARRRLLEFLRANNHPVEIRLAVATDALKGTFGDLTSVLREPPVVADVAIARVEAPSTYAEVYEIGRRVRCWLTEGIAPERVAVVFRDLGPCSQFLADVFERLNLSYYQRRGEPLAFQPIIRIALSALDAVRANLDRASLFRFLTSGPVRIAGLTKSTDAPMPHELHELARAAHVDRFHGEEAADPAKAWRARLDRHIGTCRPTEKAEHAARHAEVLLNAIHRLQELKAPRTPPAFVEVWRALWNDAGLSADRIEHMRSAEALQALDEALADIARVPAGTQCIDLVDFAELLETALSERSIQGPGRHRAGGVRILNPYDLQGMDFDCVALGGLNANLFPAPTPPDPLLGDAQTGRLREALHAVDRTLGPLAGLAPGDANEVHDEERALWALVRRSARRHLLLSRSRVSHDAQRAAPSIFWEETTESAGLAQETQVVRPAPPLADCLTGEEAELRAAWVLTGGAHDAAELQLAVHATGTHGLTPPPASGEDRGVGQGHSTRSPAEGTGEQLGASATGCRGGPPVAPTLPSGNRLFDIARRAAVERQRLNFFERLASASMQESEPAALIQGGAYDGELAIAAPEAPERLRARYLQDPEAHLSPSDLETLAVCPFRFLAQRMYRVREDEEPDIEPTPQARGSLWHRVLARFYRDLLDEARNEGHAVVRLEGRREQEYLRRLRTSLDAEVEAMPAKAFTGLPGLWRMEAERLPQQIGTWLRFELAEAAGKEAFHPVRVEFSFGPLPEDHAPAVLVDVPDGPGTLRLAGRFDRLDLRVLDPLADKPSVTGLRLLDYKTSRAAGLKTLVKPEAIQSLRNAQLPVYLAAAVGFLKRKEQAGWKIDWAQLYESSTAAYYALRDLAPWQRDGKSPLVQPAQWPLKLKDFIESGETGSLRALVRERMRIFWQGRFPVAPQECGGTHCPARFVCRYRAFPAQSEAEGAGGDA